MIQRVQVNKNINSIKICNNKKANKLEIKLILYIKKM